MRLKTLLLALVAGGVAARFYSRSRASMNMEGSEADTGLPARGADSPNAAERLQAQNVAGPQAGNGTAGGDDMFASDSQRGPYAQGTGLADFSRGA